MARPSIALDLEVETADGSFYRLPSDAKLASDRPQNMGFQTQRGDGFATGQATFNRKIFKDYQDIGLLDYWRMVGRSGDVAYEGRLHSNPRGNDPAQQINCALVGIATMLKARPVPMLVIDGRHSLWTEPTLARRQQGMEANARYNASVNTGWSDGAVRPGISFSFDGTVGTSGLSDRNEVWFNPMGEDIGALLYHFSNRKSGSGTGSQYTTIAILTGTADELVGAGTGRDEGTSFQGVTDADPFEELKATVDGRTFAMLLHSRSSASTGEQIFSAHCWEDVKVIGKHGLTRKGTWPEVGFALSDIMTYLFQRYFPQIKTLKVEENPFVVVQAAWQDDPPDGYEILQQLNGLALWETNVWEGPSFEFKPADLTSYDWIIRTDDPGVQVLYEGDTIENFANGVVVSFTDFNGIQRRLWPDDHSELRDERESNPANRHGEPVWIREEVPWQCFEAEALQWGRAKLGEFNRPRRPATYRIHGGYIEDAAGNIEPAWKVRNSQTIGVMDHPYDVPRLIYATSWDQDSRVLEVTVDAPPQRLTAIVARHELAVAALSGRG